MKTDAQSKHDCTHRHRPDDLHQPLKLAPLLDARQVAAALAISPSSLYRRRSLGEPLPRAVKLGSSVRWRQVDVERFLEEQLEKN